MPEGAVSVARPGPWGNPFPVEPGRTAAQAVNEYADALLSGDLPYTARDVQQHLAGRTLACWCPLDQPCHGAVLLDVANHRCAEGHWPVPCDARCPYQMGDA